MHIINKLLKNHHSVDCKMEYLDKWSRYLMLSWKYFYFNNLNNSLSYFAKVICHGNYVGRIFFFFEMCIRYLGVKMPEIFFKIALLPK